MCAHCIEQMQKTLSPNRWPFTRRREIRCPVCRSWAKNDEVHLVTTTVQSAHNTRVKVCYSSDRADCFTVLRHYAVSLYSCTCKMVHAVIRLLLYSSMVYLYVFGCTHTHARTLARTHARTHTRVLYIHTCVYLMKATLCTYIRTFIEYIYGCDQ